MNELVVSNNELAEFSESDFNPSELMQLTKNSFSIPRISINNALSKSFQSGIGGLGEFSCFSESENFGHKITIIPILISDSASLMDKGTQEVVCFSRDAKINQDGIPCEECPHSQFWADWGSRASPKVPQCKHSYDFYFILESNNRIYQMSFRKKNNPAGKSLTKLISSGMSKSELPFSNKYTIESELVTEGGYRFYIASSQIKKEKSVVTNDILKKVKFMLSYKKSGELEKKLSEDIDSYNDEIPV